MWLIRPFSIPQVYAAIPRLLAHFANTEVELLESSDTHAVLQ